MNKLPEFPLFSAAMVLAVLLAGCSKTPEPAAALPATQAAQGAVTEVSDVDVTEHVKTALQRTESLKGFDITVVSLKGDVRLAGVLDSQAQIDEALRIARAAEGVHSIHDELTLKK